ncbi:hypothetical protein NGRA_2513, partial [Nosema granulosis]
MSKMYYVVLALILIGIGIIIFLVVKKYREKNDKKATESKQEDHNSDRSDGNKHKQFRLASLDDKKKLYADARQWEIDLIKGTYNIPCEKLNYSTITKTDQNKNDQLKNVEFREDGVAETFRLAKIYNQVASVSAANEFSISPKRHRGCGSQEEALMSVTSGLMASLFQFATVSKLQYDPNRSLKFKKNTFKDNILFSENLQPKIEMDTYDDYCTNPEGYKFFSDYIADKNAKKKILNTDLNYIFHIYSIANKDRRSLVTVD